MCYSDSFNMTNRFLTIQKFIKIKRRNLYPDYYDIYTTYQLTFTEDSQSPWAATTFLGVNVETISIFPMKEFRQINRIPL